jgi:hypothetical protein
LLLAGKQLILDPVDAHAGFAHDLRQKIALISQQIHQQLNGRMKQLTQFHRRPQFVH